MPPVEFEVVTAWRVTWWLLEIWSAGKEDPQNLQHKGSRVCSDITGIISWTSCIIMYVLSTKFTISGCLYYQQTVLLPPRNKPACRSFFRSFPHFQIVSNTSGSNIQVQHMCIKCQRNRSSPACLPRLTQCKLCESKLQLLAHWHR